MSILIEIFAFAIAISIHEFAHGLMAYKLGDTTAKYSGRLTLNPLAHIDPIGTIILPILLAITKMPVIGWAKPVPINYWALKNPKRDIVLVGLSGPLANFILALILTAIFKLFPLSEILSIIIIKVITINIILGVFNLLPLPPLDGSRVLMGLLPENLSSAYMRIEPYGIIILFALMFLGILNYILLPVILILKVLGIPL